MTENEFTTRKAKSLKELFKSGENFQFKDVDYSSPKVSERVERLKKKQDEIINSSKVDLNDLRRITFNI
mgnify:CR=1 FL=1